MTESIGDRVRKRRVRLGLSQAELTAIVGLSGGSVSDLENGRTKSPAGLHKFAAALQTTIEYLETGRGDPDISDYPLSSGPVLSVREQVLIENYRASSDEGRRILEGAASLTAKPKKKLSGS